MANSLKGFLWELDTAHATNLVKPGRTITTGFVFHGYSTDLHKAILKDVHGHIVAELIGNADLAPVSWSFVQPTPIQDLRLTTLDSGMVQVTIV